MKSIFTSLAILICFFCDSQTITVTSPSGGDTLVGGQTYTVAWVTTGIIDSVDLYYRKGGTYLIERVANVGTYQWTVPGDIRSSNYCFFRVKNAVSTLYDENDNAFQLLEAQKSITVTFPNALTDTLYSGEINQIRWNRLGYIFKVHIYLSRNGGQTYSRISPYNGVLNTGVFDYTPINSYQANNAMIRVEGYGSLSQYQDVSDTTFQLKIGKTFDLFSPLPKNLVIGNNELIQWTSTGNVQFVNLEYSTDWSPWKSIADSIPNSGSYAWIIPQDSGSSVRIRITENNNPSVEKQVYGYSMTSSPQVLTLAYPNGGEIFTEGDSVNIQWTRSSNLNGVGLDLYYSLDSGLTWVFITDHIVTNNFHWTIPLNVSSLKCLIRVFVNGTQSVNDISDSVFTINQGPPAVNLGSPNGGEKYLSGSSRTLYFQAQGGVDTVAFDYSIDGGATYTLLRDSIDAVNSNAYLNLPNIQSDQVRFRIRATQFSGIQDESNAVFSLRKFLLSQPYANQIMYQGSTSNISWSKENNTSSTVSLYYSLDLGQTWSLIDNNAVNSGSYSWSIPVVQSDSAKIRIVDNSNTNFFDETTNYFRIIPSPFEIISPNGGEYWDASTQYQVQWTTDSSVSLPYVRLKYSINGGQTWLNITTYTQNTGSYNWITPNIVNSNVIVRVENYYSSGLPNDHSDAPFSIGIVPPTTISVNSPNGGEDIYMSTIKNILWTATGNVNTVDIQHSSNNGQTWQTVATNELNDGMYSWNVPNVNSANNLIRIYKSGDLSVGDTSDAVFSILVRPPLNLISPNGGETFAESQQLQITWDTTAVDSNLIIQFSNNGGVNYSTIISNAPNTGNYLWPIPTGYATNSAKVRIEGSVAGLIRSDFSTNNFTISPPLGTLTLTSPNGGEMWPYQTSQDITWTSTGSVGNVDLSFSIDSGVTWVGIKNNEPNDGIESWNTGFGLKSNVIVKVEESNQPLVFDISDSSIQIIDQPHTLYITTPNQSSGQIWTEGDTRTIRWNSTGLLNMVKVLVSSDNGVTYSLIADSIVNNVQGSTNYSWLVPHGINSSTCKIRVEEFGDSTVFSTSRKIAISDIRSVTILSPDGGEVFNGFDTINIRWSETGLFSSIQLAYSLDSGLNWNNFHLVQLYDTNTFIPWVAPNQNSTNVLVKASGHGIPDVSDAVFSINAIQKSITLLPIPDTVRFFGRYGIDWLSTGVTNFGVMQSLDSGQTWAQAPGVFYGGPNHFNWSGPNYNTTGVILRVVDLDSTQHYDDSQLLVVHGYSDLELISPNGGELFNTDSITQIKWKHYAGSVSPLTHINIDYSIDTGTTWLHIADFLPLATDSTFNWLIPSNLHGSSALIRIEGDGSGNEVNIDISDNFFYIRTAPELTLTAPDSNDIIYSDSTALISWNSNIGVSHVNLFYKLNTSSNWALIDSNVVDTGSYFWNVPSGINSWASIKIEVTDSIQVADSNLHVLIKPKTNYLNMIFPNGGEVFEGGKYITALWDWSGVYQFQWELRLSVDSGQTWYNINDGQHFEGVIDSVVGILPNLTSTKCLMAITSFPYSDTSDAFFTINFNPMVIDITSPNGGESYLGNTISKITWDTTTNSHIDSIYVGVKVGNNISGGIVKVENTGSSPLYIPNYSSTTNARAWARINGYSIFDESNAPFNINATTNDTMVVVSPNGGEQLISGQQIPIIWQASNTIDFIDVEFSSDSGITWISLANNIVNCGYYLWTVPNLNVSNGIIRVSGNTKALLSDESDGVFGVTISTGIYNESITTLRMYPNPVKSDMNLFIEGLTEDVFIDLISIQGDIVGNIKSENNSIVIPKSISSGTYFVRMRGKKLNSYQMLIIE